MDLNEKNLRKVREYCKKRKNCPIFCKYFYLCNLLFEDAPEFWTDNEIKDLANTFSVIKD